VTIDTSDSEALRALVREALGDLLPGLAQGSVPPTPPIAPRVPPAPPAGDPISSPTGEVETILLRNDAELAAFVGRLLHLFENPKARQDLRTGRLRFRLGPASVPGSFQPVHRVDRGAVTEAAVKEAARSGARLVLGPEAVLTPLARDRARATGVPIEKEQP
jgi:hypothetical protein